LRSPSEGVAEGVGWGEEFRHARASRRAKRGGQVRFRFLDLCIKFGKIISKACPVGNLFSIGVCEGFNSGACKNLRPPKAVFDFCKLHGAWRLLAMRVGLEQRSHVLSVDKTDELVPRQNFSTEKF